MSLFHEGEREVQERAGVRSMASRVGNGIHDTLPPVAQMFLRQQPMLFIGMSDAQGQIWASVLTGRPGFVQAVGEREIVVAALPPSSDPLYTRLTEESPSAIGVLAIDLPNRKRMRVNGFAERRPGGFAVRVRQAYANCPKYIQSRTATWAERVSTGDDAPFHRDSLTGPQQEWLADTDTFFIASAHPQGGADVSHRGGNPGFVRVMNACTLRFPDYSGNMMFNTLGNLTSNPNASLLCVNFDNGSTLQMTGRAEIDWTEEARAEFAGAERVLTFSITAVLETPQATPLRWQLEERSPFNPE